MWYVWEKIETLLPPKKGKNNEIFNVFGSGHGLLLS